MIQTVEGLDLTIEQLARMYRIVGSLHAEIAAHNYANYQIYAEGPIDEVLKLRKEIDEYLGIAEPAVAHRSE